MELLVNKNTSDHLNGLIRRMTSMDTNYMYPHTYKTFNGSCIPFIGPEWKDVDFTLDYCHIACIVVPNTKGINKSYVGFNQHQQFEHYPYFTIKGDQWKVIVDATLGLYSAVNTRNPDVNLIDLQLSKIHDNLYEFSQAAEIIKE